MIIIHGVNNTQAVPRLVERSLIERLQVMPAVVLTGARQTGKSSVLTPRGDTSLWTTSTSSTWLVGIQTRWWAGLSR